MCPEIAAFRPPPPPPDPGKLAKDELAKRYPEPEMGRALVLYFAGDFQPAPVPLQKIGEKMEKAQYHEAARALLLDINNAINLYENGTTEITNNRPEKAEVPFLKALAVDERLVLGDRAATLTAEEKKKELDKRVSFIRKAIVETMSSQCVREGQGAGRPQGLPRRLPHLEAGQQLLAQQHRPAQGAHQRLHQARRRGLRAGGELRAAQGRPGLRGRRRRLQGEDRREHDPGRVQLTRCEQSRCYLRAMATQGDLFGFQQQGPAPTKAAPPPCPRRGPSRAEDGHADRRVGDHLPRVPRAPAAHDVARACPPTRCSASRAWCSSCCASGSPPTWRSASTATAARAGWRSTRTTRPTARPPRPTCSASSS